MSDKEKKYRRVGWLTTVAVQLLMLLLFYFLIAWREPFPPIPSYGIELSFGIEEAGSGERPVANPEPADQLQEEVMEETEVSASNEEELELDDEFSDPVLDATEALVEPNVPPVTDKPSPAVVKEVPEVKKEENEVIKGKPQPEKPKTTYEQKKKEEQKLNPAATMTQTKDAEPNASKGEDSKEGVAGKKEGSLDGRALMGEQGSDEGASLQLAGWVWDFSPKPTDNSAESGKIVYKIKVDQDGYIIGIELVTSTVSPVVEHYYRQSVERLSFTKTNDYKSAPTSSGTITFIIRSK